MSDLTQSEQALHDFIVNEYPQRGQLFHTSWTGYYITPTPEEELLCAWLQIGDDYPDSPNDDLDWFKEVPSLLYDLAIKAGANVYQTEDGYTPQMDAYAMFVGDFMRDSCYCHLRDY